jgi:CYTH domain-containing protein
MPDMGFGPRLLREAMSGAGKVEIERKFLVADDAWRGAATGVRRLRDGLLAMFDGGKVRLRIEEPRAWLAVKGPRRGLIRAEFEYEIPLPEAEAMMAGLCLGAEIRKTRHLVPHAGRLWEVDVHEGALAGLVHAEVELEAEDAPLSLPPWVGREITGDPAYSTQSLLRRGSAAKALTVRRPVSRAVRGAPIPLPPPPSPRSTAR